MPLRFSSLNDDTQDLSQDAAGLRFSSLGTIALVLGAPLASSGHDTK